MRLIAFSTISDFISEMKQLGIVSKDKYGYWYLENYNIFDCFIDNWILGRNRTITDYYMGDLNPDEFKSYNDLYVFIRDKIEQLITRYVRKCVERIEENGDYALDF